MDRFPSSVTFEADRLGAAFNNDMEINYRHFPCERLIKTTVHGTLDLEGSKQMLRTLATDPAFPQPYHVLVDLHNAPCQLSVTDVFHLVRELQEYGFTHANKIAVVVAPKCSLEVEKFMELCAGNRGLQIQHFTEMEPAKSWLGGERL